MKKKVALVTGGIRGIGLEIVKMLLNEGFFVYINCRSLQNRTIRISSNELGTNSHLLPFDVTRETEIKYATDALKHETIDVLINNAGILKSELLYSLNEDDLRQILTTNFLGAIRVFEAFKDKLINSSLPTVINMASISGLMPRKGQGAYAAAKAMIIQWTTEMARLYKDKNINFFSVSPGPVDTELLKSTPWQKQPDAVKRIPLQRIISPVEIAYMVSFLCKDKTVESGSNIIYDGGFINSAKQ